MNLLFSILVAAASLIIAGIVYQRLGAHRDRLQYTKDGRWIDIGGRRRLYIVEKGAGNPTVLFEAGIAATNLNWYHIQEPVSSFAATVSYDRGGLGWSSPCRTARTPANIAAELYQLLESAAVKPPYILVGHSFGGLVMRRFALDHPEEVAGILLVDPMRIEEWPPLDPSKQSELNRGRKLFRIAIPFARIGVARLAVTSLFMRSGRTAHQLAGAAGKGGQHVLNRVKDEVGKMPQEVWPIIAAHWSRPDNFAGMRSHVEAVPDTVREMHNAEPIQDIPVLVLTPGKSSPLSSEDLSRIGNNTRQVIAPESAHWIHLDQPDLVIDSIRKMVAAAAAKPATEAG
ncbi:MAG: alpha/beta hydrolase [Terracidiphilus sp.]|jgi:pimeloyl-ACP methyl ester carboxylesterase